MPKILSKIKKTMKLKNSYQIWNLNLSGFLFLLTTTGVTHDPKKASKE